MTKITYFNTVATLFGNHRGSTKKFKLEPGSFFFPFEYALPINLPPSYNGGYGRNYYEVSAYVDIPMKVDIKVYHPITIAIQYDSQLMGPMISVSKKKGSINHQRFE